MFPKLFEIGNFFLPAYGLLVALGFLAGLAIITRLARLRNLDPEQVSNLAIYCSLAGLIGAKALMFALDLRYYSENPGRLFSLDTLLSAGVFYGGLLAALVFAWFYIRSHNLPWLETADVLAPGLAAGHSIGRLGCFAAGCCWGTRCDRPWAVTFTSPDAQELVGVPLGVPLHPTQLYEAAATAAVAWVLWRASHRPHQPGMILGLYLSLYSVARLIVESFRDHQQAFPVDGVPLTSTQWMALALIGVGISLYLRAVRAERATLSRMTL